MSNATSKGFYKVNNPEKYIGDLNNVRFMSSWELDVHRFLDMNPRILNWGSEVIAIPYYKRATGKMHKYYVDYYVKYVKKDGNTVCEELWEVKPFSQTKPPKQTKKKKQSTYLYERAMYETNEDKWRAAQDICNKKGVGFRIVTEKNIFI